MTKNEKPGGQAPFGYRWMEGRLVVDPGEGPVRVRAFELFLKHQRKGTVARILNQDGHRPRRGAEWRDVTVGRLLSCPSAKGVYAVNKTMTDAAGKRVPRPESEWEQVGCDAMVSEATWDEVNAILVAQAQGSRRPARPGVHLFSGIAVCSDCGRALIVPTDNPGKYVCPTRLIPTQPPLLLKTRPLPNRRPNKPKPQQMPLLLRRRRTIRFTSACRSPARSVR